MTASKQTKTSKSNNRRPIKSLLTAPVFGGALIVLASLFLEIWRLSGLTANRLGANELATKHMLYIDSRWWKSLSFIYGPYYFLLHLTYALNRSAWAFRLTSVIFGLASVMLVYWIVQQWHGYKLGILAASALLTSYGFLAVSRQADPLSSQLFLPISLIAISYALATWDNILTLGLFFIVCAINLYVPGAVWLVVVTILLAWPNLKEHFKTLSIKQRAILAAISIVSVFPLAYRLGVHYSNNQLKFWLGYGLSGKLGALKEFALNMLRTPLDLFVHTTNTPAYLSVGHLPLIPAAEVVLIGLGIYLYISRFSNKNWQLILTLLAACWLVIGLGILSVYAMLPLLAIAVSTGSAYLLKQWYTVFPRNPIARYTGVILMFAVIMLSCFYAARTYFVAWSNDPAIYSYYTRSLN